MTNDTIFINEAINEMYVIYNRSNEQKYSIEYNSFMCSVLRMLILIYGEDIIKCYNINDVVTFEKIILQYGYDKDLYDDFLNVFNKYYKSELKKEEKPIKKKNKYFNLVQKHLIDMMLKRNNAKLVEKVIMNDFTDLLFTAKSTNFYRMSCAVVTAYNPYEIYEYAKKHKIVG